MLKMVPPPCPLAVSSFWRVQIRTNHLSPLTTYLSPLLLLLACGFSSFAFCLSFILHLASRLSPLSLPASHIPLLTLHP